MPIKIRTIVATEKALGLSDRNASNESMLTPLSGHDPLVHDQKRSCPDQQQHDG
jgi:hypothetical protein